MAQSCYQRQRIDVNFMHSAEQNIPYIFGIYLISLLAYQLFPAEQPNMS